MLSRRKLLAGLLSSTLLGRAVGVLTDDFHVRIVDGGHTAPGITQGEMLTPVQARTMTTTVASSYVSICQALTINKRKHGGG